MAAGDLTTLESVRRFEQRDGQDTADDQVINDLIAKASASINREIARFLPAETAAAKTFVWRGGPIALHPYFLRSVTAVSLYSDETTPTALSTPDWRLRPKPAPDGVYRWLALPYYSRVAPLAGETEVTITGNWGFADQGSLPKDVEHWCNVTVVTWLRRDVSAYSTVYRIDDARIERPEALPSAVSAGLARFAGPVMP